MPVRTFSPPHLAALAVLLAACPAGVMLVRRHPGRPATLLCRGLAVLIIAAWAGEYLADLLTHIWTVQYDTVTPHPIKRMPGQTKSVSLMTYRPGASKTIP